MKHYDHDPETLARLRAEAAAVEGAIAASVDEAVLRHKRLGLPIVTWEDGRVVWTPADQITVSEAKPTTH